MTIAQIYAIIALLLAFNVPAPTVANVQLILESATTRAVSQAPQQAPQQAPHPRQVILPTPTKTARGTWSPTHPVAPTGKITIRPYLLTQLYAKYAPDGLQGTISIWEDTLVMQGGQTIWDGAAITYSLDGTTLGSPTGILGGYRFLLDTTKYSNGIHTIGISADDLDGNTASSSLEINIQNK